MERLASRLAATTLFFFTINTNAMEQSQQHPIDGADWHKAYPIPGSEAVKSVTPDELAAKMLSKEEDAGPGKSYLIVDVRRSDCKVRRTNRKRPAIQQRERNAHQSHAQSMIPTAVNFPAHSLPRSMPTLLTLLTAPAPDRTNPLLLVFHCNSCKGRGPRSATWVRDALAAQPMTGGRRRHVEVAILEGGSDAWERRYGARPVEERGFSRWSSGPQAIQSEQDLRMVPL